MQFSMDSDAAYFCTVASIERQSDAAVALAMPDPALWNEYRPADALAATPRVHYVYQSERYDTIVPNAAIYTLDGQAYVRLAVREPSYWSYDYVVRTMPVTVIERGDSIRQLPKNCSLRILSSWLRTQCSWMDSASWNNEPLRLGYPLVFKGTTPVAI